MYFLEEQICKIIHLKILSNMKLKGFTREHHHIEFLMCKILILKYNAQNPTGNVSFLTSWFFSFVSWTAKRDISYYWYFSLTMFSHFTKIVYFHRSPRIKICLSQERMYISTEQNVCPNVFCSVAWYGYLCSQKDRTLQIQSVEIASYKLWVCWSSFWV